MIVFVPPSGKKFEILGSWPMERQFGAASFNFWPFQNMFVLRPAPPPPLHGSVLELESVLFVYVPIGHKTFPGRLTLNTGLFVCLFVKFNCLFVCLFVSLFTTRYGYIEYKRTEFIIDFMVERKPKMKLTIRLPYWFNLKERSLQRTE